MAKTFNHPPIGVIEAKYYNETRVTLDMGGHVPKVSFKKIPDTHRLPVYRKTAYNIKKRNNYSFSTDNFGLDVYRKRATNMTGGVPYSNNHFYVTGNPSDYYNAQKSAAGELNIRPQWLSGYKHSLHQELIRPTTNPYGGSSWRRFYGHGAPTSKRGYLAGTTKTAHPRDDAHGWFYHINDAYFQSGDLWIKDWYEFVVEFRKTFLNTMDPWPDSSNRAIGHALAHSLAAYKVTGQTEILDLTLVHFNERMKPIMRGPYDVPAANRSSNGKFMAAAFQNGYLIRSYITLYHELLDNQEILSFIGSNVAWINEISNYSYYWPIEGEASPSGNGTSLSAIDSVAWYIYETGDTKYRAKVKAFVIVGLGGKRPYGQFKKWHGQYEGRMYLHMLENE